MPGTAPTGWKTPKTNWASADVILPEDVNRIEGNINAVEAGTRTIDPSQVPSSNQGTLRQLLDWFANRIRAITGTTNWWDAPAATVATIWSKFHQSTGHKHTGGASDAPPIPLNGIASAAKTSPGGTEANRLVVTNSQGAVGLAQSALDAQALGGVPASGYARIATGVYTGNDVDGRAFNLGFQPKLVRVYWLRSESVSATGQAYITEASPEMTAAGIYMRHRASGTERTTFSSNYDDRLEVTATGFIVGSDISVNYHNVQYAYIAIG